MTDQRLYTPELAVDLRIVTEPRLAPDGGQVAFCVAPIGHRETQRTSAIFVATPDASAPLPLTDAEHNNVTPRWAPDGRALAFLSDRLKRGEAQLHVVSAAGGEAARLTGIAGGVAQPAWAPDGSVLYVTARRSALAGQKPESKDDVQVISAAAEPRAIAGVATTGGAPYLIGPAEGHVWSYALSPDGAMFAALVTASDELVTVWDGVELVLFDSDGSHERRLGRFTNFPGELSWSPDGRHLAFVSATMPDPGDDRVYVVDVAGGEVRALDPRGGTPGWVGFQGDDLLVLSVFGQRTRLERTDPMGSEWDAVELGDAAREGWLQAPNIHASGHGVAVAIAREDRPADLYVAAAGAAALRVTNLNPQLVGVALARMEPLAWRDDEGLEVEGWLALPPGHSGGPLPLVVNVHGGPSWQWGNWFHGTWHDWAQALAARGFAVLLPNPRGSTGRGASFTGANRRDFGGGDFADIMRGVDLLIERGVADPARLGIGGWSYGGFMTAWAITQTNRFKAAVAGAAPTNWVSKVGTTDIGPFNEWNVGQVHAEPDAPWERSPIRYLSRVTTPTLVVHGEADKRVPVTQGRELWQGLRAAGVPTEFVSYPRQEHGFHERAAQLDLLQRVIGWFERYLEPTR